VSLKWRIAIWYATLLIAVLLVTGGIFVWRLQGILYDQAKAGVSTTMHAIVEATQQTNPFALEENGPSGSLQFLYNSANLANWNSATSFVQVDSRTGYPLAKTANLGDDTIPANPQVSAKHDTAFRNLSIDERPFVVEDRFLHEDGESAIVHVAAPLDAVNQTFRRAWEAIGLILAGAAVAVLILSIVLAAQATTPIGKLAEAMREIGSDRLDRRLRWERRNDEIGKLAQSFDDLLLRLAEAFARERQFISDASHELKTPLTSINSNAQMLLRWADRDPEILRESLETVARESASLADMVNGMLTLAKADRGDEIPKEPVSLAQVGSEAVQQALGAAREKGLDLEFAHDGTPTVYGSAGLLRQLAGNLVDNAVKFTERGRVDVRVGGDDHSAWLEVSDSGPGIPEAELQHVFERFYRADKARSRAVQGTGLGLAIVQSIARVHGGQVAAKRAPSGGAVFRATFPRMQLLTGPS
jgi:two-component system OmpR family sensor kinase